MSTLKTFSEFRSTISIIEIATANGYTIDKSSGLKWPVLENEVLGDKIIIVNAKNPANQGYWNAHNDKDRGTLINFVENRLGSLFPHNSLKSDISNVNAILYSFLNLPPPERKGLRRFAKKISNNKVTSFFKLPEGLRPLDNPEYLLQRGISKNTLAAFQAVIKNVKSGPTNSFDNIAFPYFDKVGNIVGFEVRNKRFKKMEPGSNRSIAVWHSKVPTNHLEKVILTESPIDALSYFQLKGKEYPVQNTLYVAFGGSVAKGQLDTVQAIVSGNSKKKNDIVFVSAVDNDKQGRAYTERFKNVFDRIIEDYPIKKDHNEDLMASQIASPKAYNLRI